MRDLREGPNLTRAMSSNEVEEDFGGELGRRDEVLEGEREVDEVSFGNAGALEVSIVSVDENSKNFR